MDDEGLLSARHVAEHAYCPRLFYFMEVEGVFLPSVDTVEGTTVHRRVDKPSASRSKPSETATEDSERPRSVRSLTFSSQNLGITAVLDIAEIQGNDAVPVEYRKGRPHRVPLVGEEDAEGEARITRPQPWPTDRVQVGLQALLLEEAGYTVREAVLYYAAEKLRLRIPVDEALRNEARATIEAARKCAEGERPAPLVNDPKCFGCSLQPICLPDEVQQQRVASEGEGEPIKRRWPPRDDGIVVIAQRQGTKVGVRGECMRVTDRSGGLVREVPLATIESVALLGSVQMSTQAVHVFSDHGIPIAFLSAAGRLVAMVDPMDAASASVRRAQVRTAENRDRCLELSRALVAAKIQNQRTLLVRNHPSLEESVARELAGLTDLAKHAPSLDVLRGQEGQAAAVYFASLPATLHSPFSEAFDAVGRKRRPPPDPVNACLSMGYSMLTKECITALRLARLEPSIGAFHVSRPGRPALALDLMEPFRPLVADSVAISAFNRGELWEGHFTKTAAGCLFTDAGRQAFFKAYGRRMDTEVTHPVFEYKLSYRRMIGLHALMLSAWMLGDVPTLSFLTTR